MTYSTGPYSRFTELPVPPRPEIRSAREVRFETGQYVIDPITGGYKGMPPTLQRVVLLIAFEVPQEEFITPQANARVESNIRKALKVLTSGKAPDIKLHSVTTGRTSAGRSFRRVVVTDLTRGIPEIDITVLA